MPNRHRDVPAVLTNALHYAALGYAVLPIAPGDKRPHPLAAPRGINDATTNRYVIAAWFLSYPDANLAVVVPDGVAVFDFDSRDEFERFRQRHRSLANAPYSHTPRGVHIWVAVPHGVRLRSRSRKLMPQFEIKRPGKAYVLEEPSRTATGAYTWGIPLRPVDVLPSVPAVLLAALQQERPQPVRHTISQADVERLVHQFIREALPGNRHNALVAALSRLAAINAPTDYRQRVIDAARAKGVPNHEISGIVRWVAQNIKVAGGHTGDPDEGGLYD